MAVTNIGSSSLWKGSLNLTGPCTVSVWMLWWGKRQGPHIMQPGSVEGPLLNLKKWTNCQNLWRQLALQSFLHWPTNQPIKEATNQPHDDPYIAPSNIILSPEQWKSRDTPGLFCNSPCTASPSRCSCNWTGSQWLGSAPFLWEHQGLSVSATQEEHHVQTNLSANTRVKEKP